MNVSIKLVFFSITQIFFNLEVYFMATKHFLVNPNVQSLSSEDILEIENRTTGIRNEVWTAREKKAMEAMEEDCPLKHTYGRVIVRVNLESKNYHTFEGGGTIRRERNFNEFNRRITQPTNAIVISGNNIEKGSEILISHNAVHDTNKIFSYQSRSRDVQYFSIPEYDCFAWRDKDGQMRPMENFEFGLRVFKPYQGMILGQPPTQIKDVLYITTGTLKGNVVHTLKASDYQIIYQNTDGREANLIRVRHSENEGFDREEIQAISHSLTDNVIRGTLLIGLTEKDCKTLKEYYG